MIIIYGGETESREYPNDMYAFNTRTRTWSEFHPRGPSPEARSRAAVVLVEDLLYISGGTNENGKVLDDLVVLDLNKMIWRRAERFDCRYDHTAFYHDEKIFIYGGLTEQMNRSQDLLSLHLPTLTRTLTRITGPATPSAGGEGHFYYPITASPSPMLLDFVMPVFPGSTTSRRKNEASVSSLDLHRMHWVVLESTPVVRDFVWENLVRGNCNDGFGIAYFIGYPGGSGYGGESGDVFSHVLEVDLSNFGIVVNEAMLDLKLSVNDEGLGGIARDLVCLLEDIDSTDFSIVTEYDDDEEDSHIISTTTIDGVQRPNIRCHTLILQARWSHFKRLLNAKMSEFHTRQLILPEPYTVIKSLITYFYTDILPSVSIPVLARLLVLANLYQITRLRTLCLGKLLRELTVEYATIVWSAARESDEKGLERRAGKVCFENWGEVVRTKSFRNMKREDVLELCGLVGRGAKVVDVPVSEGSASEIEEDNEDEEDEGTENEEMEFDA
jgi:BTB/POZ domain/Galactose oxidase, central domain